MSFAAPLFWQPIDRPLPPGAQWAGSVRIDEEGTCRIDLPRVRSIALADPSEVIGYRTTSAVGSVAHHVRFAGGGKLWFVFNDRRELVDLAATAVRITMTPEGDCTFAGCAGA